ncbi:MAG: DUF1330 domain-containing protein [Pseudomonadales bacterium]|nr:DUF1330 domain-containing protein [Pseudomonadales bacterium]
MPSIDPSETQMQQLMELTEDGKPLVMINCLRYNEKSQYSADSDIEPSSGKQAFQRYGEESFPYISALGGKLVWMGAVIQSLIAPEGEQWDDIVMVQWPNLAAFKALMDNSDYLALSHHRDAALADSRLIITCSQFVDF